MPVFAEFAREDSRGRPEEAKFTLQARGLLSFNHTVFRALGEPEAVALLYAADEGIVALGKVEPGYKNAYQVRKQQKSQTYLVGAQGFTAFHGIQTLRARRFVGHDYGDGVWGFALREGVPVTNRRGADEKPAAITGTWRHTTNGGEVPSLMRIGDKAMSHPGYLKQLQDQPPSVRLGILVACEPLGPKPPTSELRTLFLDFLKSPPVSDLVSGLSAIQPGTWWTPWGGRGRMNLEAAMLRKGQRDDEAPVASAMLLLPESGMSSFGHDPRCAELVLDIEPRGPQGQPATPMTVPVWYERFVTALGVPAALSRFLTRDLQLATANDPPAQLGVWMKTPIRTISELVDIGDLERLPGAPQSSWFMGFAVADPEGEPAGTASADFLRQMCDYTLHVQNYESLLASLDKSHM